MSSDKNTIAVAIDVMGGDQGSLVVLDGVFAAYELCRDTEFTTLLCGDADLIRSYFEKTAHTHLLESGRCVLFSCDNSGIEQSTPTTAWKEYPNASIVRAISLQQEGKADVSVSAGDTGTLLASALFILGKAPDVSRPALAAYLPTLTGQPVLILDVGANLDCKTEHLVSFAKLGRDFVIRSSTKTNPTCALLNVGTEPTKGTAVVREAAALLSGGLFEYAGFIEASHVLSGSVDVVVCDGFAGNVLLKSCESFYPLIARTLKNDPALLSQLKKSMAILNTEQYGAAPFLGVNGMVFKAHGGSSAMAIAHALSLAVRSVSISL